jgi:hypothetical protein
MPASPPISCASWLSGQACYVLETIGAGMNSSFSTALLGSLAGAFAGAIAAQRIAERSKRREALLTEIRSTNSAIMIAGSICNTVLAVKIQHVKPLWDKYQADEAARAEFEHKRKVGQSQGNAPFQFTAELRTFPCPTLPIGTLQDLVFNRLTVYGRPLSTVATLAQSVVEMADAYVHRAELIEAFNSGQVPADQMPYYYFGLRLPTGHTNRKYPDIVSAISSYTDDCIFFSSLLANDLHAHGQQLRTAYEKAFGKCAPTISRADFSAVKENGMHPPDTEYADWLKGFPDYQTPTSASSKG